MRIIQKDKGRGPESVVKVLWNERKGKWEVVYGGKNGFTKVWSSHRKKKRAINSAKQRFNRSTIKAYEKDAGYRTSSGW